MLDFADVQVERNLVALCPEAPYHFDLSRDAGLQRVDRAALQVPEQTLLDAPERSLIYVDDSSANALAVGLSWEDPRYSATIALEAAVESQQIKETCRIRCVPQASRVARLRVQCSQPNPDTTWRLVGDEDAGLSARREVDAEATSGGETWQLTLLRPRSEPFEIEAVRTSAFVASANISVVSLPEATSQEATLEVRSNDGTPLRLDVVNLKPVPARLPAASAVPRTRAVYSYDPARDAVARVSRAADIGPQSPAWIWSLLLVSRIELSGDATHEAVLRLENTGLTQFSVVFPPEAGQGRVIVNGEESAPASQLATSARRLIRLPRGDRFPTVLLRYTTPGRPLGLSARLEAAWPQVELPCLERKWSVWLPPSFAAASDHRRGFDPSGESSSWDERLFGFRPFRRQQRPFDPFSSDAWRRLQRPSVLSPAEIQAQQCLRRLEAVARGAGQIGGEYANLG